MLRIFRAQRPIRLLAAVASTSGAFAALLLLATISTAMAQPSAALSQKSTEADEILAIIQQDGFARVIVRFETPVPASQIQPDALSVATVRARVAAVQDAIIASHFGSATNPTAGQGFARELNRFEITPGFAVSVSAPELEALATDPRVQYINYNRMLQPTLLQSVPLIGMTNAYNLGATGNGQVVAVLDTGVKSNHEFLSGKVIAEACFSNNNVAGGNTLCPNGQGSQIGAGAANPDIANCTIGSTNICDHGTHVSGIAAGFNTNLQSGEPTNGVAKDGKIWAIQIFTRSGSGVGASFSDIIRGLDHVFTNMNSLPGGAKVASTNMSLGGGLFSSTCDGSVAKPAIDNLRNAGVLSAIASGNDGSTSQVSEPGCISTAVTVGSTTKSDVISSFSNSSAVVDLLAPGSSILSSITVVPASNTTTYASFNGTSMATPHVAGAIAAIRTACPSATANQIESALKSTGLSIADTRAGGTQTKPRIRVDLAVQSLNCGGGTPPPPTTVNVCGVPRLGDFNADARGDLVWRQNFSGSVAVWLMSGTTIVTGPVIASVPVDWHISGVTDFNADGRGDLLWRHTDGSVAIWLMNGTSIVSSPVIAVVPPDWTIAGVGDFNGDGRGDILWRHRDGSVAIWFMNGTSIVSGPVFASVPPDWHILGVGDFNGDGKADIVWRHSTGAVSIWLMNGTSILSGPVIATVPKDWNITGVGDFNGDGKADLLWRHNDGSVAIWLMDGTTIVTGPVIATVPPDWTIRGVVDVNADNRADIAWLHRDGSVAIWLMNGTSIVSGPVIAKVPVDWGIVFSGREPPPNCN